MSEKIGYARVSTLDQNLDLQIDALKKAGCDKIYIDKITGGTMERKEFQEMLKYARAGDTIVVWKLDRLGRSLKNLLILIDELKQRQIEFISTTQNIDTSTPTGKVMLSVFGMMAELEKDLVRERTMAGLKSARARGRVGGRPKALTSEQIISLKAIYETKKVPIAEICKMFEIKKPTMYKYLKSH